MAEGVCLTRVADGIVIHANPKFAAMFGYAPGEIEGRPVAILNASADVSAEETARSISGDLQKYGSWVGEIQHRKKDGTTFWCFATTSTFEHAEHGAVWISVHQDITNRKRAERALGESEERFRLLVSAVQDYGIFMLDPTGHIVSWNEGAARIKGYREEEVLGRHFSIFYAQEESNTDRPAYALEQARKHGRFQDEGWRVRKDGSRFWADVVISALLDTTGQLQGFGKVVRDVTERRNAENALRKTEEFTRHWLTETTDGMWDWNIETGETFMSPQGKRCLGYEDAELANRADELRRLVHTDDLAAVQKAIREHMDRGAPYNIPIRYRHKDGSLVWLLSRGIAIKDENGRYTRMVGTHTDITALKQAEALLESKHSQVVSSARLAALGMMAGGVAHEVNNPLAIIHATAADLLEAAEVGVGCKRIMETVERMNNIVKGLLQISRDGSKDAFVRTAVSEVVNQAAELCKARFRGKHVQLLLSEMVPGLLIHCREVQIAQILLNLLQNALDAVEEQEGERWVRLEVARRGGTISFSVSDSGPGMTPDIRARIMEPFFTTKPVGKGTGLGLSISKAIAEEHGGTLRLEGGVEFTCFTLSLPAADASM